MLPFPLIVSVLFSVVVNARAFEESREFRQTGVEVQGEVEVEGTPIEKSMVQGGQGTQVSPMNTGTQVPPMNRGAQMQRPIQPVNQQYPHNQAPHNQYSNNQAPSNQQYPSHNQQHPPIFQYPHQSGITTPDDPTDPYLLHADPWCTVDDPFADGALEALIADMDRKSRPEREQGEYGIPTMNEFARARQKSGRRAIEDEDDESMDGQQQMFGAYSPFHSVMDYNCPNGDPYAADDEDESSSSASGYYYHHPAPPRTKSRRSRRTASSKSISRLLDTLNNQPTNPFADQRKSRKSRRTTGRPESRMSRRSVSRPGSVNSMITMDGTAKNLKNKKDKSKLKLKSKLKSKKHTQNQNKKNINGGRK